MVAKLKLLGELRDGILVLSGAVYLMGYVVWAIISWRYSLGSLPVLDMQYFSAGLSPTIVLLILLKFVHYMRILMIEKWPKYYRIMNSKKRMILVDVSILLSILLTIALCSAIFISDLAISLRWKSILLTFYIFYGLLYACMFSVVHLRDINDIVPEKLNTKGGLKEYFYYRRMVLFNNFESVHVKIDKNNA